MHGELTLNIFMSWIDQHFMLMLMKLLYLNLHLLYFIENVKLQRPADTSLLNCPPSCILVQRDKVTRWVKFINIASSKIAVSIELQSIAIVCDLSVNIFML